MVNTPLNHEILKTYDDLSVDVFVLGAYYREFTGDKQHGLQHEINDHQSHACP